jgi:hypothetical protein
MRVVPQSVVPDCKNEKYCPSHHYLIESTLISGQITTEKDILKN